MTDGLYIDLRRSDPPQASRFLFTGRLDNRRRLAAELGREPATAGAAGDAALARAAWERWGPGCAERFRGPFAFVGWDAFRRRVVAVRDALGERTLCYAHDAARGLLVAGFDEAAVLAHPVVPATPDDDTWARWFAVEPPRPGATFYAAVHELPPATRLLVDAAGARHETWWKPPTAAAADHSDGEWAHLFRTALEESVEACLEDAGGRVGVALSGGLDSSSVALLAARQGAAPLALSWVFDTAELTVCDERRWIDDVVRRGGLEPRQVMADDAVPLAGPAATLALPGRPPGNPYRPLKQRLYAAAREAGVGVVLTGACGDLLWTGGRRGAAASLLAAGRPLAAAGELAAAAAERRWGDLLQAAAGLVPAPARRRSAPARPWLRSDVARRLELPPGPGGLAAWRRQVLTGLRAARGVSGETAWAAREGVEVRDPYRDRRLVELALTLPPRVLHRRGEDKVLLRRALADLLPPSVASRRGSAPLLPLFLRGVCGTERQRARELLQRGERWRRYVREEWLDGALDALSTGPIDRRPRGAAAVAVWRCLAAELWEELNSGTRSQTSSRSLEALERSA